MQKHRSAPPSYHFVRSNTYGLIQVLNEGWYVMAEYSERTGGVKWQRVVLASQREMIEKWLREHYPVQAAPAVVAQKPRAQKAAAARG